MEPIAPNTVLIEPDLGVIYCLIHDCSRALRSALLAPPLRIFQPRRIYPTLTLVDDRGMRMEFVFCNHAVEITRSTGTEPVFLMQTLWRVLSGDKLREQLWSHILEEFVTPERYDLLNPTDLGRARAAALIAERLKAQPLAHHPV